MNTNILSKSLLTIIITTALALVTVSFALSPKASQSYRDFTQQHAGEFILPVTGNSEASPDYFQRHLNESARQADTTDYIQRHPVFSVLANAPLTASDYFMRHPELSASAEASLDMTDYFFRHLDRKTSSLVIPFSAEQIRREYILGERYGVTLRGYAEQQALREFWLGERYGQTP